MPDVIQNAIARHREMKLKEGQKTSEELALDDKNLLWRFRQDLLSSKITKELQDALRAEVTITSSVKLGKGVLLKFVYRDCLVFVFCDDAQEWRIELFFKTFNVLKKDIKLQNLYSNFFETLEMIEKVNDLGWYAKTIAPKEKPVAFTIMLLSTVWFIFSVSIYGKINGDYGVFLAPPLAVFSSFIGQRNSKIDRIRDEFLSNK